MTSTKELPRRPARGSRGAPFALGAASSFWRFPLPARARERSFTGAHVGAGIRERTSFKTMVEFEERSFDTLFEFL
jgi:hypothetical protein